MDLTPEMKAFIREHLTEDTGKLLLTASRFPNIDVPFAIDQILARRQIREKLPFWFMQEDLIYPSRLSAEQCSSESTALYKQRLLAGNTLCDLTGGLGIDSFYFAQKAKEVCYIERFPEYCEAARHNFRQLKAGNIRIIQADSREIVNELSADTFYIDPARRSECNKRIFALNECEPDVIRLKPILLGHSRRLIVKISPMADIGETLRLLPETREIHILAVKNECKELLFVLEGNVPASDVTIHAVHLGSDGSEQDFVFHPDEEKEASLHTTQQVGKYLYEPHTALLKSGAFKLIAIRFGLSKLHRHSHLYTSDNRCEQFPGRTFFIENVYDFSGKLLKQLGKEIPKANMTTRNFPLSVAELRKRSNIKEGGSIYLFATTLNNEHKIFIRARKA